MAEQPAALYARLTGRRHIHWPEPEALRLPSATEIVVASVDALSFRFVETLYDPARAASAPGLILGIDQAELQRNILIAASAAALPSPPLERIVQYHSALSLEAIGSDGRTLLGRDVPDIRLEKILGEGSDLLIVTTHSDGIDAPVGRKVICPLLPSPIEHRGVNRPTCLLTQHCHRLKVGLSEALASGRLISPRAIRSRVVLLRTCFGLLPNGALNDYRYGLLRSIAANPKVGAVIASWNVTFADSTATEHVVDALRAGASLGAAVAEFNRSPAACQTGDRMCLVGDPNLRFARSGPIPQRRTADRKQRSPSGAKVAGAASPLASNSRTSATFLRDYLTWSVHWQPVGAGPGFEDAAGKVRPMLRRSAEPDGDMAGRNRAQIVSAIGGGITLSCKVWCGYAKPIGAVRAASDCPACGEAVTRIEFRLSTPGRLRRRLLNCPRCGIVEDAELDAPSLNFRLNAASLLSFSLGTRHQSWRAALRVECVGGKDVPIQYKSGDGHRAGEHSFELPEPLDAAAIFLTLFLVDGLRLTVARIPSETNGGW